jgi:hypothetical protein
MLFSPYSEYDIQVNHNHHYQQLLTKIKNVDFMKSNQIRLIAISAGMLIAFSFSTAVKAQTTGGWTIPATAKATKKFQALTDGEMFYQISEGKGKMPVFKKTIADANSRWAIVNYMRTMAAK